MCYLRCYLICTSAYIIPHSALSPELWVQTIAGSSHSYESTYSIKSLTGQGISSEHPHSVNVFYADGHGASLSQDLSAETIRVLLTHASGETLNSE